MLSKVTALLLEAQMRNVNFIETCVTIRTDLICNLSTEQQLDFVSNVT
jgi:hypothetical protein